jgi:flagellar hook-associated protein 2
MATGALSSLGIGSSVLTYDIIEQLREADESAQITPIDTKMEENIDKQADLAQLTGYLSSLKSAASSLSSDLLFQSRDVTTNGSSATLSADAGVATGAISVDVEQLASQDIYQTTAYDSSTTSLGLSEGDITLSINGEDYTISVTSATTLSDLSDMINEATNGEIQAKVLNVGGQTPYRLIIQSSQTGEDQAITFGGDDTILGELGLNDLDEGGANEANHLATAQDAIFKYNSVTMQRSSNTIDDITYGSTLTLVDTGKTTFSVSQDSEALFEEMENFVTAYNDLVNNLSIMTDYDSDTGESGSLQGVSQVTSIKTELNKLLTSMDSDGRSLDAYGLTLEEGGLLSFDSSTLQSKLTEDPTDVEDFFKGMTTFDPTVYNAKSDVSAGALEFTTGDLEINGISVLFSSDASATAQENTQALRDAINEANIDDIVASIDSTGTRLILTSSSGNYIEITGDSTKLASAGLSATSIYNDGTTSIGIFSQLYDTIDGMIGDSGSLTLLDEQFTTAQDRLEKERERTMKMLDSKYETMVAQFAAYDAIIADLNNQFSTLQTMIETELDS